MLIPALRPVMLPTMLKASQIGLPVFAVNKVRRPLGHAQPKQDVVDEPMPVAFSDAGRKAQALVGAKTSPLPIGAFKQGAQNPLLSIRLAQAKNEPLRLTPANVDPDLDVSVDDDVDDAPKLIANAPVARRDLDADLKPTDDLDVEPAKRDPGGWKALGDAIRTAEAEAERGLAAIAGNVVRSDARADYYQDRYVAIRPMVIGAAADARRLAAKRAGA